ncbi:chitin synthase chs-2-like [Genypterus blacodes]|uniref:chitin synthase chs-2-like n=1 Tax=Genypterus blacodes TaxID=154954 RepID=UPI003F76F9A8
MIKLLKIIALCLVFLLVFGLALCSKTSFLLLITLAHDDTKTIPKTLKPVALLCIACALVSSSVLLFLKSLWKACYKTSKLPSRRSAAVVLTFEFLVSLGAAVLTIVAMPQLDIVTNVTILNSVAILSTVLQMVAQSIARERNRFVVPSIAAFVLILLGYALFVVLYVLKDISNGKMALRVGLAVAGCFLVSFNWYENYLRLISENRGTGFLVDLCTDLRQCQNVLHIMSSLTRIVVTACVVGAYVPLSKMDWGSVTTVPSFETKTIVIIIGVQLISSALCEWFVVAACKMHAMRRCFLLPLYLASLAVMALLIVPVIVYYHDFRANMNGTDSVNFTGYCAEAVYGRNQSRSGNVFPHLVLDVTQTLCFLDLSKATDIGLLAGLAVAWWLGLVMATLHLWFFKLHRIQRTQDLFIRRLYEGAFIEQSLLLNTRFDVLSKEKRNFVRTIDPAYIYLCATMWHETYEEMINIIISIFRLDKYRPKKDPKHNDFSFEAHIYFDDAFLDVEGSRGRHVNEYARSLVHIISEVYSIFKNIDAKLFRKEQEIPEQRLVTTPYGGRLVVIMPHGNHLVVHFKDKDLIRHKKRWSQVMYLYYLLGWKLMNKYYAPWAKRENESRLKEEVKTEKQNTYLLALDGDTDFQPAAVMLLIDRLKMYPRVGAACGRIHPTGAGPVVWFQKFEYAISHWLHKTAEHVFGCVLCSPGCFSLFRAEALMDDNVMRRYTTKATEASHHIQYDQGEDRWLCTLLLKQGWRVEYNAASDAYTQAPEDFKELYNQRRRWGPSTMANVMDLLSSIATLSHKNPSMSKPYMFYQLFAIISSILGPSTIIFLTAGSFSFLLNLEPSHGLIVALIPPVIFLIICFKLKSDTQIVVAAILSTAYAFLMLVVILAIIGSMVKDQTILTPSSIFIVAMAVIYIVTAIMHPQETHLVFYGLLYILCIPSAYLLLTIYSMVNMNNVSWGTRETARPAEAKKAPQSRTQKVKSKCAQLFSWVKCCKKSRRRVGSETDEALESLIPMEEDLELLPQNTIVEDGRNSEEEQRQDLPSTCPEQCWVSQLQTAFSDLHLPEEPLDEEEAQFFRELQKEYLQPVSSQNKAEQQEQQKKMAEDLRHLRNKINFAFFMINAVWMVVTFTLQSFHMYLTIKIPKVDVDLNHSDEYISIDPVALMFILGFALSVVIQFFGMLYHRILTLVHYVAFLDTDAKNRKQPNKKFLEMSTIDEVSEAGDSEEEESELEDRDDFLFPPLYRLKMDSETSL